jgi:hypothetical protein
VLSRGLHRSSPTSKRVVSSERVAHAHVKWLAVKEQFTSCKTFFRFILPTFSKSASSMTFVHESGNDTTKTANVDWWGAEHRKRLKNSPVPLKCAPFAPDGGASALLQFQLCDFCHSGQRS